MDNHSVHSELLSYEEASQDPQFTLTHSQPDMSSSCTPYLDTEREQLIWGTTISIKRAAERFRDFVCADASVSSSLTRIHETQDPTLFVDCNTLDPELRSQLSDFPQEALPIFENAVREVYSERFLESLPQLVLCPYNLGPVLNIRDIDPSLVDRAISLAGIVTRCSAVDPEIHAALFRCVCCSRETRIQSVRGLVAEPTSCDCGARHSFELVHSASDFSDRQIIKVQELACNVAEGTAPMTMTVVARSALVDTLVPGDSVELTGILKAEPVHVVPRLKKTRAAFRVYVELLAGRKIESRRDGTGSSHGKADRGALAGGEHADHNIGNTLPCTEYLAEIDRLRRHPRVLDVLSRAVAPSVFGLDAVKKGLLLQLVGGIPKDLGTASLRGDINVLLAGDPGIAKSQLLAFVNRIAERGLYTSGRGSSAVGLTASVARDPDSGQFLLESGALVLSDGGTCCIDEFDKISEATRSVLHEVMEQQTVSLAKAGIITTLNARCAILASCNPLESRYNLRKTIVENLNLPPTLLSRFDLVFLLLDTPDEAKDRRLAEHVLKLYAQTEQDKTAATDEHGEDSVVDDAATYSRPETGRAYGSAVSLELLQAYVREARRIVPIISPEGHSALAEAYVSLRQLGGNGSLSATTRQLESLVRLSEAHARLRFSYSVERVDVEVAQQLVRESLLLHAVDPRTGRIDIGMVQTGVAASRSRLIEDLKRALQRLLLRRLSIADLLERTGAEEGLLRDALGEMELEGAVYWERSTGIVERIRE